MSTLLDKVKRAREQGDFTPLLEAIPYARFLGIEVDTSGGELISTLRFAEHLIGNSTLPALHGGTLGSLLESTAIFKLLWEADTLRVPKTINITVEFLRTGKPVDTFAKAEFTRQGRRVANVRVMAWQQDPDKPIAACTAHFLLTPADEG